jgi:DNA-binding response OmpR family regulator
MRILIVEDDIILSEGIGSALKDMGWVIDISARGEEAWFLGSTENYDAIILDLSLPELDGIEILQRWRKEGVSTPVLVLTARSSWLDRVAGINMGADDYLPKPFRMEELTARLHAIIRRSRGHHGNVISCGGVSLNMLSRQVQAHGRPVELGPLEWRALSHLMLNCGVAIPPFELAEHVYGPNSDRSDNAIEALILRLRRKIGSQLIKTRRGAGYIIESDPETRPEPEPRTEAGERS